MFHASVVLAALGVAVLSVALAIPTQSVARVSGSTGGPDLLDGSSELTIAADPLAEDSLVTDLLAIAMLPASPAAPPAPKPLAPVMLGFASGPGTVVVASWYGPGFFGNRTACGQTYTSEILGVAHRTLPCGTLLRLDFGGRVVTVPVIDRGPYIAGRTLDLSNATRAALGCTDLCPVRMQ